MPVPSFLLPLGLCAGKSSTAGSEPGDSDSLDYPGSRTSGGGRRGGRRGGGDSDYEEELMEVDPFDAAVEQLYEKRWGGGSTLHVAEA